MADNDIEYRVNVSSAQQALRLLETAAANVGKAAAKGSAEGAKALAEFEAAVKKAGTAFESVNDRAYNSNQRYLLSLEKRVALEGKSGTDRLIAERDQLSKRFGQNAEQLARFNAQYEKLIKLEQQSAKGGGQGAGMLALRGVRDLFEGRVAYGEVQIGKSLASLNGVAFGAGAAAAAVIGLSIAGYKAAESFAKWGAEQSAIQQKLGLTARELAQFQFAARASGTDINSLERALRGIAIATEDLSPAGNRAREVFASIGFSLQDANGKAKPFGQALQELAVAVDKIPAGTERAAFMIETLKRSGIESIPALHELATAAKKFDELGLPFQDQQSINNAKQMNVHLAEMGQRLDHIVLSAKEAVATGFFMTLDFVQTAGNTPGRRSPGFLDAGEYTPPPLSTAGTSAAAIALRGFGTGLEGARAAESVAKEAMDKARVKVEQDKNTAGIGIGIVSQDVSTLTAATREYEKQKALVEAITKSESDRKGIAEELRKITVDEHYRIAFPTGMMGTDKELLKVIDRSGSTSADVNAAAALLAPRRLQETQQAMARARAIASGETRKVYDEFQEGKGPFKFSDSESDRFSKSLKDSIKNTEEQLKDLEKGYRDSLSFERDIAEGRGRIERTLGGKQDSISAAQETAEARKATIDDELRFRLEMVDAEAAYTHDAEEKRFQLRQQHDRDLAKAEIQYAEEVATRERQQLDEIKKVSASLYTTLFTHPSNFPRQLATTVRSAALAPVIGGLSEMTARALHDPIFGADGRGGIAGAATSIFGGAKIDNGAMLVKVVNATFPSGSYAGGGIGGGYSGGGSTVPFGSVFSAMRGIAPLLQTMQVLGGGTPIGTATSSISYAGGDQNVSLGTGIIGGGSVPYDVSSLGSLSVPGSTTYGGSARSGVGGGSLGGFNPLALLGLGGRGGSGSSPGGLSGAVAALKGTFGRAAWANSTSSIGTNFGAYLHPGSYNTSTLSNLSSGPASGTPIAGMVTSGGIALAEHGLLGNARGTWSGTAQGAAGGFLVAGPIGAAVGFGIGVGEQLAGVESPRNKAIREVKEAYHINISNGTADQIAELAKTKYASQMEIAVRSPEVRQMLGLYAAGTGQASKFPQSADMPMGGSLAEQGGVLRQSPVYQYGNPYTYSSSLPVAGGVSSGSLPNPGGNVSLSLNVSGKSTADFLNGEVFTPEATSANVQTAWANSAGRTQSSMTMSDPTGIVG